MSWTNSLSAYRVSERSPPVQPTGDEKKGESHTVNSAIAVLVSFTDHLVNLIIGELLANRRHDVAQLGRGDEAVVVAVEYLAPVSIGVGMRSDTMSLYGP